MIKVKEISVEKEEVGKGKGEGERERELAKAALSVAELGELCTSPFGHKSELGKDALLKTSIPPNEEGSADVELLPLDSLAFVKAYAPNVDKARDTIIQEMESMVVSGLADLVNLPSICISIGLTSLRTSRSCPRRCRPRTTSASCLSSSRICWTTSTTRSSCGYRRLSTRLL